MYKTETQDVSDVQNIIETLPVIPAEPDLQELPIIPVQPELQELPIIPVQPELQGLPIVPVQPELQGLPIVPVQPVLQGLPTIPVQPELQELPIIPIQPELQGLPIVPVQPVLQGLPIIPTQPELPILPTQPLPILPVEPEANQEPQNDEHSTPESIASVEIIRKNSDVIINYLNNKFNNSILIDTEMRVLLLADFITVYSDLKFGPNITDQTIEDYCAEFTQQIEILSNRTFESCNVPEGTVYKPGNVVTLQIQSTPSSASGAIGLVCSLLIIALSSVIMLRL